MRKEDSFLHLPLRSLYRIYVRSICFIRPRSAIREYVSTPSYFQNQYIPFSLLSKSEQFSDRDSIALMALELLIIFLPCVLEQKTPTNLSEFFYLRDWA